MPIQKSLKNQQKFQSVTLASLRDKLLTSFNRFVLSLELKSIQLKIGGKTYKYSLLKLLGILIGSIILVLSMQHTASAQVAKGAESNIQKLFNSFLPSGSGNVIQLIFGIGRFVLLMLSVGLIIMGLSEAGRGQGGDIWFLVGGALLIAFVLVELASRIIYGTA
jgi:hypothetical protein